MRLCSHLAVCLSSLDREEEGQGLIEYGLILTLVSIVSIGALQVLGVTINDLYTTITAAL